MTDCTAPGCTNSDAKRFIVKVFIQDPVRAQWMIHIGKKGGLLLINHFYVKYV